MRLFIISTFLALALLPTQAVGKSPPAKSPASKELVTLKNTQAERVLAILENVYRSQLTSGGGRKNTMRSDS